MVAGDARAAGSALELNGHTASPSRQIGDKESLSVTSDQTREPSAVCHSLDASLNSPGPLWSCVLLLGCGYFFLEILGALLWYQTEYISAFFTDHAASSGASLLGASRWQCRRMTISGADRRPALPAPIRHLIWPRFTIGSPLCRGAGMRRAAVSRGPIEPAL